LLQPVRRVELPTPRSIEERNIRRRVPKEETETRCLGISVQRDKSGVCWIDTAGFLPKQELRGFEHPRQRGAEARIEIIETGRNIRRDLNLVGKLSRGERTPVKDPAHGPQKIRSACIVRC